MKPNITQLVFNTVQDAFLGGYLAAGMTKTGKVATYGGMKFGTVTIYMDGFWDGVQYYNKQHHTHVQVLGWSEPSQNGTFAGSFTNITEGQTIANTFIHDGADIIFPVAGGVGLGTAKAVQTADPPARTSPCSGWTPTAASAPRPTASTSSPAWRRASAASVKAAVLDASKGHVAAATSARSPTAGPCSRRSTTGEQGPRVAPERAQDGEAANHQRQDRSCHQEPGVVRAPGKKYVKLVSVPGRGRGH